MNSKDMSKQDNNWPALRFVHLVGGCHAINEPGPSVKIGPKALNGKTVQFQLSGYGALYSALYSKFETIELPIIGVDFYSHVMEIEGRTPPDWRPFHKIGASVWFCEDVTRIWSEISHSAHRKKNGRLWDLASRIKHQLRVCSWRLRQISVAYNEQLSARLKSNDFKAGQRFEDGFTWLAYLSIQAFLVDACVLRDYLAEFANYFVLGPKYKIDEKVSTMAALKGKILNHVQASDIIVDNLKTAVEGNGWIKQLGEYRDLVVHVAPLARAEKCLFAVCRELNLTESDQLAAIACPIPDNPAEIIKSRVKGDLFSDFEHQLDTFWKATVGETSTKDGLEYAHLVTGWLSELSNLLAQESPLPPEKIVIGQTDIIGPIITKKI